MIYSVITRTAGMMEETVGAMDSAMMLTLHMIIRCVKMDA